MSAFIGPIHHWLYRKITLQEGLVKDISNLSPEIKAIEADAIKHFGPPETSPLESVIDHGNIHGWLQKTIEALEARTAYIITHALASEQLSLSVLKDMYHNHGRACRDAIGPMETPEDAFKGIQDTLIDGMPCDRVNQPIHSDTELFKYQRRTCIHGVYWENPALFYDLRQAWLLGFMPDHLSIRFDADDVTTIQRRANV